MLGLCLQQQQKLELTLKQKLEHKLQLNIRLLELTRVLMSQDYYPAAKCRCGKIFTEDEIFSLFSTDPKIYTIKCPECGFEFQPILINSVQGIKTELPYYCPCQTLDRLKGMEDLSPDQILKKDPSTYRSTIKHYKTFEKAFSKNGVKYGFITPGWKELVTPYLGKLPDRQISVVVGKSPQTIRRLRDELEIEKYIPLDIKDEKGE